MSSPRSAWCLRNAMITGAGRCRSVRPVHCYMNRRGSDCVQWARNRDTRKMRHKISVLLFFTALLLAQGKSLAGSQFTPDKDILRATLKNGLRVVIVRNPLAPVATTVVAYQVGSNEAPDGFPGTAHALEHMMFRGNPGLSSDQLAQISAAMGGSFDANTQQTLTQYYFTVPSDDLDLALHIESLRMSGILATDELWGKERGAIEQEVA